MSEFETIEIDLEDDVKAILRRLVYDKYIKDLEPPSIEVFDQQEDLNIALGEALVNDLIISAVKAAMEKPDNRDVGDSD